MNRIIRNLIRVFRVTLIWTLVFGSSCGRSSEPTAPRNKSYIKTTSPAHNLEYIKVGEIIPEIKTYDFNGQPVTIASSQDKAGQLIVVYSPTCEICHAMIPRWIELYRQFFLPRNIPFIALSVQNQIETSRSIREMNMPFRVVQMQDVESQFGYKIPQVPITIALNADGSIKDMWVGKMDNKELTEVIKAFCPECSVNVNNVSSR